MVKQLKQKVHNEGVALITELENDQNLEKVSSLDL